MYLTKITVFLSSHLTELRVLHCELTEIFGGTAGSRSALTKRESALLALQKSSHHGFWVFCVEVKLGEVTSGQHLITLLSKSLLHQYQKQRIRQV